MPGKPPEPSRPARPAAGRTLFDEADSQELRVPTSCRRTGRCRECIVEVTGGAEHLSEPTEAEAFLRPPFRLACQAELDSDDAEVDFAVIRRRLRIVTPEPEPRAGPIDPPVRVVGDSVYRGEERLDTLRGGIYGLAIDVGTTTVAFELVDLGSG